MGEGASFALRFHQGPPPHGRGGLLRFGTTGALAAWARGPTSLWNPRGPRRIGEGASTFGPPGPCRMSEGASFALGKQGPPPHGREGLLRFWTAQAPAAWARGPFPLWIHRGPRRMGAGASFALDHRGSHWPRWSQSKGGPLAHAEGASVVSKRRRSPRPSGGASVVQSEGGPLAHAAGAPPVPKRRRPPRPCGGGLGGPKVKEALLPMRRGGR